MIGTINISGGILGLLITLFYCIVVFKNHSGKPELTTILAIMLSSVGVVTGVFLGYVFFAYKENDLGCLGAHKIPILLGGIALAYISIETIYGRFSAIRRK